MLRDEHSVIIGSDALPLLQELGEVLELGVLSLDGDLVVRGWNRWLAAASGIETSLAVGRALTDVFPELSASSMEAVERGLAGITTVWAHRFHRFLLPLPAPAGHETFAQMQQSARIMPLVRDGQVDGVLVLVQDVTERVAREEELRAALRQAEVASEAKSDFLASMSHELRTPLSAIIGYMDLLTNGMAGAVEPLQRSYFGRVKIAAQHLVSIIEEVLTFSRVEAGKEPVRPKPVDAVALLQDVKELFEPQAVGKGIALALTLPDQPTVLHTDATKLRQILINVIGNAVKFTDAGEVGVVLEPAPEGAHFRIRDTGPGIDACDLERIFDPFTQVDQSLTRVKGGTGLGLPVSRRLAHLLGGDLVVESIPDQGTVFTLWLPSTLDSITSS